jgi:hypothetical protein
MEGLIQKPQKLEIKPSREGEESLVFLERMSNPQTKEKFINFILECEKLGEQKRTKLVMRPGGGYERQTLPAPTKESLSSEYDESLRGIIEKTPISFEDPKRQPVEDCLNLNFILPEGKPPTNRQWSIIEAHEKGHLLRPSYFLAENGELFLNECFDFQVESNVSFGEFEAQYFNKFAGETTFEKAKLKVLSYLSTPGEIMERMSQIKNYFGMSGNEVFTKEHLVYAKENYVKDTGFDNWMTLFFKSIKPEKEDRFVELMNTVGI